MRINLHSKGIQLWTITNHGMNFVYFCISIILINLKKIKMKKLLMCAIVCMGVSFTVSAQTSTTKEKAPKEKMSMKEHVCTDACKKAGHCVMAPGEKCTKACCKKGMKAHVCTDACKKAGHCVMAHGEKGHVCGKECKKMAMKDHVCTDACKKAGHCVMAHGEKGHVCGKECKKA